MFGKRWMYEDDPEVSKAAIRYTKFISIGGLIIITIIELVMVVSLFT
ncbi:hypothetical protein [Ornithinibacillus contaminans]|nr:hypothetical protein [Ornithinibacillus contaminans]